MPCLSLQASRACALCTVITVTAMLLFLSNGDLLTSYTCATKNEFSVWNQEDSPLKMEISLKLRMP